MLTTPRTFSPWLVAAIDAHRQADRLSIKEIELATDTSYSTAERITNFGWEAADRMRGLVNKLRNASAAYDVAAGLVGPRFGVVLREPASLATPGGVMCALQTIKDAAALAVSVERVDADGVRTPAERAEIARQINEVRAQLDRLEAENNAKGSKR